LANDDVPLELCHKPPETIHFAAEFGAETSITGEVELIYLRVVAGERRVAKGVMEGPHEDLMSPLGQALGQCRRSKGDPVFVGEVSKC
jgi:hypothetical protein